MTDLKLAYTIETIDKSTAVNKKIAASISAPGVSAGRGIGALRQFAGGLDGIGVNLKGLSDNTLSAIEKRLGGLAAVAKGVGGAAINGVSRAGGAIKELADKAEGSYGTLAAAVGGGIEIREIIKDNDEFDRLRIITGATREEIMELREDVLGAAGAWGVQTTELRAGIDAMREGGTKIADIRDDMDLLGAAIQRVGAGSGEGLGDLFASLRTFEGVKGPKDLLADLSTLNSQLEVIPGGLETFIVAARPLLSTYAALGQTGPNAVRDIGAVYGVIAQSTSNPRQARSETLNLLELFRDRQVGSNLMGLGVDIYGGAANYKKNQIEPLSRILPQILSRYGKNPEAFDSVLGESFSRDFKLPLAEIRGSGKSESLDKLLSVNADPGEFLRQATEAGDSFGASLERVHGGIQRIGEDALSGPLKSIGSFMKDYPTVTSMAAIGIGTVGVALAGIGLLAPGVRVVAGAARLLAGVSLSAITGGLTLLGGISLSGIAVGIGAAVESVGTLVAFSPALSGLFATISGGFLAVGVAIEATPIGWIITGIPAVAAGAYLIYEKWTPIKEWMGDLWQEVLDDAHAAVREIESILPSWITGKHPDIGGDWVGSVGHASQSVPGVMPLGSVMPVPANDWNGSVGRLASNAPAKIPDVSVTFPNSALSRLSIPPVAEVRIPANDWSGSAGRLASSAPANTPDVSVTLPSSALSHLSIPPVAEVRIPANDWIGSAGRLASAMPSSETPDVSVTLPSSALSRLGGPDRKTIAVRQPANDWIGSVGRLGPALQIQQPAFGPPRMSEMAASFGDRRRGEVDAKDRPRAEIKITFDNLPEGFRVGSVTSDHADITVELGAGYAMAQ